MSFLKLLFWIFLIYFIVKLVRFSFYFGKVQNQVRKNFHTNQEEVKREGTTTIKYIPEKDKKTTASSSRDDDYIDYEEIK